MRGKRGLITAALLIAGIRLWMQVRGKTKTPFAEWAIGWGALFFIMSLLVEAYPDGSGLFVWLIVVTAFLQNGASLFNDISGAIVGAEKGQPTLTPQPFSANAPTGGTPPPPGTIHP